MPDPNATQPSRIASATADGGFLIFLLDESSAMNSRWGREKESKAAGVVQTLQDFVARVSDEADCQVGVMGYRCGSDGSNQVGWRHSSATAGGGPVSLRKLRSASTVWYTPDLGGEQRPQQAAFQRCHDFLRETVFADDATVPPVVVVHIFSGGGSDGSIAEIVERLQRLPGAPAVFHVHLAGRMGAAISYASDDQTLPDQMSKSLYPLSSLLPVQARGELPEGSRGLIVRAARSETADLLDRVRAVVDTWRAKSQRVLWRYPDEVADRPTVRPPGCFPAGNREQLYACVGDRLVALSRDGAEKWSYRGTAGFSGTPVVAPDEGIRAHSRDGWLHCVDPTGRARWNPLRVGTPLSSSTPVIDENNNVYISSFDGGLLKIDQQGHQVGSGDKYLATHHVFDSTGVICDGVLYIGANDHFVHAIKLGETTAQEIWDHRNALHGLTGQVIQSALVLAAGPVVVAVSRDDHVYGFGLDGQRQWQLALPGRSVSSPAVDARNRIVVGTFRVMPGQPPTGKLVCIDPQLPNVHSLVWAFETPAPIKSTPVIATDGTIYVGDSQGTIYAVDENGQLVWQEALGSAVESRLQLLGEELLLAGLDNGQLAAARCSADT